MCAERPSVWVEAWSPGYGASYELDQALPPSEEAISPDVEMGEWEPLTPPDNRLPPTFFIDGVSRIDARAFLEVGSSTAPGLCGSVGIGAVIVDGQAAFGPAEVHRTTVFGFGTSALLPPVSPSIVFESRSVPGSRPEELRRGLEALRAEIEAGMARDLARRDSLVIADGALGVLEPLPVVGFIKSHHRAYLSPALEPVVRELGAGQRTPIFGFGVIRPRYSWYLRLADRAEGHPWAGVARCEVSAALPISRAVQIADITSRHLPRFASKPFWDARAPQNLVPIAALERRLWHLLGSQELVYRKVRSALATASRTVDA